MKAEEELKYTIFFGPYFPGKYYIKFPCILWSEGPSI
jgi:hypothetical protein